MLHSKVPDLYYSITHLELQNTQCRYSQVVHFPMETGNTELILSKVFLTQSR